MAQFLSDFAKPSINANIAQRVLANEVLRGVAQGVLETNGEGITQRFSNDVSGAQIRITQFMPFNMIGRELGADINGDNFNGSNALTAMTNGLGVDVITTIDQTVILPQVTQDMLPIDFLENSVKNINNDINNNINAMTIAGKFVATANAVVAGKEEFMTINTSSASGDDWRMKLMNMDNKLDNGDVDAGLSFYPEEDRCFVFKTSVMPFVFNKAVLSLGGANSAYNMLAMGGISEGVKQNIRSGYAGEIYGRPVYKAGSLLWKLAAKYAGIPVWKMDGVLGYESSGYANVRALAQGELIKIVDARGGQGVELQPLFRMGFKSLYASGNVFLVESGFENPASEGALLTLTAPASRTAYSNVATLASVSVGGAAATADATDVYKYTADAANSATTATITATATKEGITKIDGLGTFDISVGANTFYLTATAQDGTKKVTTLVITRAAQ